MKNIFITFCMAAVMNIAAYLSGDFFNVLVACVLLILPVLVFLQISYYLIGGAFIFIKSKAAK